MVDSATAAVDHEKNDLSQLGISPESIETLEAEWNTDDRTVCPCDGRANRQPGRSTS